VKWDEPVVEGFWAPTQKQHGDFGTELKGLIASWPETASAGAFDCNPVQPIDVASPATGGNLSAADSDPRLADMGGKGCNPAWQAYLVAASAFGRRQSK